MTSFGSRALSLFLNVRRFQHCLMHLRSTGHRYIVANHQLASVEKDYFGLMRWILSYISYMFLSYSPPRQKKLIIASFLNLLMAKLGCDLEVG